MVHPPNSKLDNLEWVTFSGNLIHAYEKGLRKENFKCTLTDLKTDEVHEFYSLAEAAKFLKIPPSNLTVYLRKVRHYPLLFKYAIKVSGIKTADLTKDDLCKSRDGHPRPFYLVNNKTKKKEIVPALAVLKERFPEINVHSFCRLVCLKLGNGEWTIKQITDPDILIHTVRTHPYFKELKDKIRQRGNMRVRKGKKIKVIDLLTNEIKEYPSVLNFCKIHNLKKGSVQKAIWRNNFWKHYKIEYLSE